MKPGQLTDRPLRCGKGIRSSSSLKTLAALRRSQAKHAPPRDTGFSPEVKLAVRKRAGLGDPVVALCEPCGIWLGCNRGQVRPRVELFRGGGNPVVNAVLLCGDYCSGCCSLAMARDPAVHASGWWLTSDQDPRLQPVMLHRRRGPAVWLTESAGYSPCEPGNET